MKNREKDEKDKTNYKQKMINNTEAVENEGKRKGKKDK